MSSYRKKYITKQSTKLTFLKYVAAGNPSNGRCPASYFYSSTSGLVGKWLYDHYLKLMNNCVR